MKRNIVFLTLAIGLGGTFATVFTARDHAKEQINAPVSGLKPSEPMHLYPAPAMMDYTPATVVRPTTPGTRIDHRDVVMIAFSSPIVAVAHGPPKFC